MLGREALQPLLGLARRSDRSIDPLRALFDHPRDHGKAELRQKNEDNCENDGHPEQETTVRQHQIHDPCPSTLRSP